jgi:hypothetical protein
VGWGLAGWIGCQSAACGARAWLARRLGWTPPRAVLCGAACCAVGLLLVTRIADPAGALAAYALTAGTGAGLVYGSCVAVVADWFPDRPGPAALVSGAFGFGAVPVILAVALSARPVVPLDALAWGIAVTAALCAPVLRDAPRRWWPPAIDPRRWAVDRALNPTLRQDPAAVREHSAAQVLHTRAAWVLAALALSAWAAALFDVTAIGPFALAHGWSVAEGATGLAAFAAASGLARPAAVRLAGLIGRPRVAALASLASRMAQLLLAVAVQRPAPGLSFAALAWAGAAAGSWVALLPGLARSYFGDRPGRPNLWLLYSAKAAGGVLGAGLAGWLAARAGCPLALTALGVLGIAAATVRLPRRPGLLRTLPFHPSENRRSR